MNRWQAWLDVDPAACGRLRWTARTLARNVEWARTEGVGRLVEEHDARPVRRATAAARRAAWRARHGGRPGQAAAAFLSGAPRSGTNMLLRTIAAAPEVEAHNEGDRAAYVHYRLRADPVVAALVARSRHRVVLFKPLLDAHRLADLLDLGWPRPARAIWIHRGVDARGRSALRKFGSAPLVALADVANGTGSWRWQAQGLSADGWALLRGLDWARLTPADGVALVWYLRNRLYFDLGLDRRADVLPVGYDDLVRAPADGTRAVFAFLGIGWHPRVAAQIDARAAVPGPRLDLHPAVRERCEALAADLAAVTAARTAAPVVPTRP